MGKAKRKKKKKTGVSRVGLLCLGSQSWLVKELSPCFHPPQITPTAISQKPVRVGMLSRRLNAKSIQLHHPLLHLTFQGTCISSLCCQTFSTCYFALVPHVNASGVPWGWAGRSGSTKVNVKVGMRVRLGPLNFYPLLASLLCFFITVTTEWGKAKK